MMGSYLTLCEFYGCEEEVDKIYRYYKIKYLFLCSTHVQVAKNRGFEWVLTEYTEKPFEKPSIIGPKHRIKSEKELIRDSLKKRKNFIQ